VGQGERLVAPGRVGNENGQRFLCTGSARRGLAVAVDGRRETGHGGRRQQDLEGRVGGEGRAHFGGDLGGQQRVAAELEEIVVGADARDAEGALPDASHLLLDL